MTRDMTKAQFIAACRRNGIDPMRGPLGHHDVGHGLHVSALNAGPRLRDQLAYLIEYKHRNDAKHEAQELLDAAGRIAIAFGGRPLWPRLGAFTGAWEWEPRTWASVHEGEVLRADHETRKDAERLVAVHSRAIERDRAIEWRRAEARAAKRWAA